MTHSTDVQRRGKEFFAAWSPAQERHALGDAQLDALVVLADRMIPADPTWPAPSATEIRGYMSRGAQRRTDVALLAEAVAAARDAGTPHEINAVLAALQRDKPVCFRVLQEFVYYGYYAQPEVVRTIREALACDYISPPQPRGYDMPFDTDIRPATRAGYVPTDAVKRVDLSGIDLTEEKETA
ncbi:hypothetical protein [Variovorax sp. SRS16]|uniref:hypothetical protein n=1 Tax=Variovorax sp. SRS16 TaxID=282217 RepID=UPI001E5A4F52|nr:hypothetical protein [Variovorax sp. SRS16]